MGENCFCHFNGYEVKDAFARECLNTKAPNGFGLGETVCKDSTLAAIDKNGFYCIWLDTANGDPVTGNNVFIANVDGRYGNVHLVGKIGGGYIHRDKWDGVWGPWEWVNPPMQIGKIYRTTERYNEKVVYCAAIGTGDIAAKTKANINIESLGASDVISVYTRERYDPSDLLVHHWGFPSGYFAYDASTTNIFVYNNYDSTQNKTIIIKYTRD